MNFVKIQKDRVLLIFDFRNGRGCSGMYEARGNRKFEVQDNKETVRKMNFV